MTKIKLFDIEFDALTMAETVSLVEDKIKQHIPTHLLGVNADKINELNTSEKFNEIIKSAEIINADGASVILASKFLKKPLPERVAGIDLMQELLQLSNKEGYSVYFLGAREYVVKKMIQNLQKKYSNIHISGYRNGYFDKNEWNDIAQQIKKLQPDIVFIGISSPTKEYLIDYFLKGKISSIFMGVGGSFDVLSGEIKRAPKIMQKLNMEWLYRVKQEPRRLFKRYFIGNFKFAIKICKAKFHIKVSNN